MKNEDYFGNLLAKTRKIKGFSQRELAEAIGINYTYLSKIENGIEKPSEKILEAMAEKLNLDKILLIISAGKIPSDLETILITRPQIALEVINKNKNKITQNDRYIVFESEEK